MFISTGISVPLEKIVEAMSEAEKGKLNFRLNFGGRDEFQRVAESFNHMLDGICDMIAKVLETSDSLATSSQQLSSASIESAATLLDISKNVNDIVMLVEYDSLQYAKKYKTKAVNIIIINKY